VGVWVRVWVGGLERGVKGGGVWHLRRRTAPYPKTSAIFRRLERCFLAGNISVAPRHKANPIHSVSQSASPIRRLLRPPILLAWASLL